MRAGIYGKCWNDSRGLIADNSEQKIFSQQANILAVLYDVIPKDHEKEVLRRMLAIDPATTPDGILSASYYFRFYLSRALDHAGMADEYLHSIEPWRKMLALHFSTWPETPGNTRSDSHAWSAHPIYDLLTLVAGIEPASPGFATVHIAPHLGNLTSLKASYPHPQGMIEVEVSPPGRGTRRKHNPARHAYRQLRLEGKEVASQAGRKPDSRPGKIRNWHRTRQPSGDPSQWARHPGSGQYLPPSPDSCYAENR